MAGAQAHRLFPQTLRMDLPFFRCVRQRAFEFATTENKLILNADREKLKAAPGFDQDAKWPDFADRTWGKGIYKYYGHDPYWKR